MSRIPEGLKRNRVAAQIALQARAVLAHCREYARRKELGPKIDAGSTKALAVMDSCIGFMAQKDYQTSNPAIALARAPIVAGLWITLALTLIILIWGVLAPIDSAVIAGGSIVLSSNRKTVQHLEGGIIDKIFVKDGDKVSAGQKLLSLSNAAANASHNTVREQLYDMRAAETRLRSLMAGREAVIFDSDILQAGQTNPVVSKIIATQTSLFEAEREAEASKIKTLGERAAQYQAEIEGLRAQKNAADSQRSLVEKEIGMVQELLKSGYATKPRLYALQKSQSELIGSQGQLDAQIMKAQQAIAELDVVTTNQKKEFETKNAENLRETQGKLAELLQKLGAAQDITGRTTLTAPMEGIVMGLKYHTQGGVVAPGAPIMDIVPQNDPLVVDVRVNPADIGSVHPGMEAKVMFAAYKARRTPKVPAIVTHVSADTFTEERNNAPYYTARLEVDKNFLGQLKNPIDLYPGSPVNVFIRRESRTFLNYLFTPILDSTEKAFKEE